MEESRRPHASLDIDELLEKGFWRSSRSKTPDLQLPSDTFYSATRNPRPSSTAAISTNPASASASAPFPPPPARKSRGPPPPRPLVEDELVSLARELQAGPRDAIMFDEPPFRGALDQLPILLEATIVGSAELETTIEDDGDLETARVNVKEDRRFVLLRQPESEDGDSAKDETAEKDDGDNDRHDYNDRDVKKKRDDKNAHTRDTDTTKNAKEVDELPPYRRERSPAPYTSSKLNKETDSSGSSRESSAARKTRDRHGRSEYHEQRAARERQEREERSARSRQDEQERSIRQGRQRSAAPPLERRRSRQDLPSLKTDMPPQSPSFRRTASETGNNTSNSPRSSTQSASFLSPDAAPSSRGHSRTIDAASSTLHQQIMQGLTGQKANTDRNRSAGDKSHSASPATDRSRETSESRPSRSRRASPERSSRLQVEDPDARFRRRSPSTAPKATPEDSGRHRRGGSTTNLSSNGYISNSDSESMSERERRARHRHRHRSRSRRPDDSDQRQNHEPQRQDSSFLRQPEEPRHRRSGSRSPRTESSFEGRLESRNSLPVPPKTAMSQSNGFESKRGETFPITGESRKAPVSRPVSPSTMNTPSSGRAPFENNLPVFVDSRQPVNPTRSGAATATSRYPPVFSTDDDGRPSTTPAKQQWQPPSFQPATLEKPVGSYRRYSQDIEGGRIKPLPPCPRTTPTAGLNDWLTLPGCKNFNICSSCYSSIMANTEFRTMFIPSPLQSADTEVACDFGSSPWYRIAWLMTLKEGRRDLKLVKGLASVQASVAPCRGKQEATRQWYSVEDPDTGYSVPGFNVCRSCVYCLEVLLPSLRDVFIRAESNRPQAPGRICSMRFDSKRFVQYFDALETASDHANDTGLPPDIHEFVALAKQFAKVEECQRDADLIHRRWYMITQLPEFTVCEECWDDVIRPEAEKGKAIARMFSHTSPIPTKTSCQLYSNRMRAIFKEALYRDDYVYLATHARERKLYELNNKRNVVDLKRAARDREQKRNELRQIDNERDWELARSLGRGLSPEAEAVIRQQLKIREWEKERDREKERDDAHETAMELARLNREWKVFE